MKVNVKLTIWSVVAAILMILVVVMFCDVSRETTAEYEVGPTTLSEISRVMGGGSEGAGCYTIASNACSTSKSDTDYCTHKANINDLPDCLGVIGRVYTGNSKYSNRTKEHGEEANTLNKTTNEVKCYSTYEYQQESYSGPDVWGDGYKCSSSFIKCEKDTEDGSVPYCRTCILDYPSPPIKVDSSSCNDP
jgi:hypothetical protein